MAFSVKYIPLFKVEILHHYFLNKGDVEYSSMSDDEKAKQLVDYDVHSVFSIRPCFKTVQQINGHNLGFKKVNDGFVVWSKVEDGTDRVPFISLNDDFSFTFIIQIKESILLNYTDLNMNDAGKLYYLSNRRLSTEPGSFPLINNAGGNNNVDESFILSDDGEKAVLETLETNEKENLFGIIRIYVKADISALNLTDVQGKVQDPYKTFDIVFKNRKTTWRYFFDTDQQVQGNDDVKKENGDSKILITKKEQPLTQTGFISVELDGVELPNPSARLIKPGASNKYYSEIYM